MKRNFIFLPLFALATLSYAAAKKESTEHVDFFTFCPSDVDPLVQCIIGTQCRVCDHEGNCRNGLQDPVNEGCARLLEERKAHYLQGQKSGPSPKGAHDFPIYSSATEAPVA